MTKSASSKSSANAPAGLIVEFPTPGAEVTMPTSGKSVTFSPISLMRTFKTSEHERQTKSYRKHDYQYFGDVRNYEIARCSSVVALKVASGQNLTKDDIVSCRGIEHFLSPDIPRRIAKLRESKESHTKAVLREQARPQSPHSDIKETIARVSERNSRAARSQARHRAAVASCVL